ncbi:baseplate J/gp47 family protein [Acinetobacter venetianus]|uniref:baseplate J/gp47 family protein n=1 Tax=Acinetobacter venetianus TaxID=52133 RepID=UPI00214FFBB0|nr:baseplate J/gp47 family protein [Acinetobacter venetianus]MCR4530222.1 baseplate J/gp47 family protein [Acinetobacter venetianus]
MAFKRKTLTELVQQSLQNISSSLPESDSLLRFSNLNILGTVQGGMNHQQYGYLDYIALQATPYTATDEYLAAWGALRSVYQKAATQANGPVVFNAVSGAVIPDGTKIIRSDGKQYLVLSTELDTGIITATIQAVADPDGISGADGNCDAGTQFALGQSISGVNPNGISGLITGGADLESQDDFKSRVISAYQNTPQGGAKNDYEEWASEVSIVSRAWCAPLIYGPPTVGVYFLVEPTSSNPYGIPQGTNGVATNEERATAATGDQLIVADYIYPKRPVTALVHLLAPTIETIDMSIQGIKPSNRAEVTVSIAQSLLNNSAPGKKVQIASLWAAVNKVDGADDFSILSPTADVVVGSGAIAVLGNITWS